MRFAGAPSWQMRIDSYPMEICLALWIRAVERIPVPGGGLIPGPLDLDPIPPASEPRLDPAQGVDGWTHWWEQLLDVATPDHMTMALATQGDGSLPMGEFPWLSAWPDLRRVVSQRAREESRWHNSRKWTGTRDLETSLQGRDEGRVVRELERELHRKAPPFVCELIVLPVVDYEIRRFAPGRFLVPERVYDGAAWTATLGNLIRPLFD